MLASLKEQVRTLPMELVRCRLVVCNSLHDNMLCSNATAVADRDDGHLTARFPVVESSLRQGRFRERRKTHCKLELIGRSQFPVRRDTSNAQREIDRDTFIHSRSPREFDRLGG